MTWNTAELTTRAVGNLLTTDQGAQLRVLVQDNASTDGTAETLAAAFPELEIESNAANLGFARAMNQLLRRSAAPWFLALNSDAWPEPGAIGRLVDTLQRHPRAAVGAPLLLRPDGTVEHSTHPYPSLSVALIDAVGGRTWMPRRLLERRLLEGAWKQDRPERVDWAVGAALLMRRAAVDRIGGFDERFFMYVEDLEWCWRARRQGWSVRFDPSAVVRHVGDASGSRRFADRRRALEAANLDIFLRTERGSLYRLAYKGLRAATYIRLSAASRWGRGRGIEDVDTLRSRLKAELGLEAPVLVADDQASAPVANATRLSVVVSTRNRAERLSRLVRALEAQSIGTSEFDVIMVDDGSDDTTPSELARLASDTTLSLRTIRSPGLGPAAGRNLGWRLSSAEVIAFTDDDCVPDPAWLEAGLAALGPGAFVVGRTRPPDDQLDLARRPFALALDTTSVRFYETCNAFYRRADLARAGGFDERFQRPSGEDTDLALRVLATGIQCVFAANAVVYHDVRARGVLASAREATRWVDLPLLFKGRLWSRRRSQDLLHRWVFWKDTHPPTMLALLGLVLGLRRRAALVLLVPWLRYQLLEREPPLRSLRDAALLPGALLVDSVEIVTMIRGSIRHRTILL